MALSSDVGRIYGRLVVSSKKERGCADTEK